MIYLITIAKLLHLLAPILLILGCVVFLWGSLLFFSGTGDELEKKEGKKKMLMSAIFFIFSMVFYLLPLVLV